MRQPGRTNRNALRNGLYRYVWRCGPLMARIRKHASDAARQAAYRERLRQLPAHSVTNPPEGQGASHPATSSRADYRHWHRHIVTAQNQVEAVGQIMASYFDSRSESWQEGERGEAFGELQELQDQAQAALEELSLALGIHCLSPARKAGRTNEPALQGGATTPKVRELRTGRQEISS